MTASEFSRMIRARPSPPPRATIEASETERAALALRFGVSAIRSLHAELTFEPDGGAVQAIGSLSAQVVQTCAVSVEDFTLRIDEPLHLRFVPEVRAIDPEDEAELPGDEPDEIEFPGDSFDLGEAVAQSLGLAIDPYAEGPNADGVRNEAGLIDEAAPRGPLAEALAKLRKN